MDTEIKTPYKVEYAYSFTYSDYRDGAVILGVFITFLVTVEIVVKLVLFRRRKKRFERYAEAKLQELREMRGDIENNFWRYIKERLSD